MSYLKSSQSAWEKTWPAPAKLNLFLHVTGQRPDGYHELQTLFQILDWGDQLIFYPDSDGRISRKKDLPGIDESQDLSLRAAALLREASGADQGVCIELVKHIPAGAGLGGGSSDAATVLLVLNQLWSCGFSTDALADLGLQLGADVPLFIHGHSAWATGVGEQLVPRSLGERHYVLVFPEVAISTAAVFASPELPRNTAPISSVDFDSSSGVNDCEAVVRQQYPEVDHLMKELADWGCPRLTGTGSTIFLSFDCKKDAKESAKKLKCLYNVRAVSGVDQSQLHAMLAEK